MMDKDGIIMEKSLKAKVFNYGLVQYRKSYLQYAWKGKL